MGFFDALPTASGQNDKACANGAKRAKGGHNKRKHFVQKKCF